MDAGKIQISGIFQDGRLLEVPFYQRSYVWDKVQWDRFMEDMAFISLTGKPFFFGSIILKDGAIPASWEDITGRKVITDGQQRLTTLMIFMKVLALKTNNMSAFNKQFRLNNGEYALAHGKYDAAAFRRVMNMDSAQKIADPEGQSRIIEAFNYFTENMKSDEYNWNVIKQNALFVCIDLQEGEDEQQVFDTINSPGVSLSTSELLKNYFFSKDDIEEYDREWVQVFEQDEDCRAYWQQEIEVGRKRRSLIDIFFDAFFQILVEDSRFSVKTEDKIAYSRVDRLAASYKDFIAGYCGGSKQAVIGRIGQYAKCFSAALRPEAVKESVPPTACIERMNVVIFGLSNSTVIPYVLFVEKEVEDAAERNKLYAVLESYLMRRIICHATTKNYNRLFVSLIRNRVLDEAGLTEALMNAETTSDATTYMPGDAELKAAFHEARLVNLQTKGILYLLESSIHPTMSATMLLGLENYSLEHLMPKKWRNHWHPCPSREAAEKRDAKLLTPGNLAIIPKTLNASIRDADWPTKLSGKGDKAGLKLCAAGLCTMQEVINKTVWDEASIDRRADWLYEQARKIWPTVENAGGADENPPDDGLIAYDIKNKEYIAAHPIGKHFTMTRGGHSEGYQTDRFISRVHDVPAFLVLAGGTAAIHPTASCPERTVKQRREGAEVLDGNRFNRNVLFTSATAAAEFICYDSANGCNTWKTDEGIMLGDIITE